jgi:hypothetical protein
MERRARRSRRSSPPPQADGGDAASATDSATTATTTTTTLTPYTGGSFQGDIAGGYGHVIGAGDASPWLVENDGYVHHYNNDLPPPRGWPKDNNSANTSSLAVSPEGTPWKIDTSGNVSKRLNSPGPWTPWGNWQIKGNGFHAYEIAVGRNNNAWAISRAGCNFSVDCPIYQWSEGSNQWNLVQGGGLARHIAVAPDGSAYVSNHNGTLFKWSGSTWFGCGSHPDHAARRIRSGGARSVMSIA